jgi:phosphonate transport system substrate-binding protein
MTDRRAFMKAVATTGAIGLGTLAGCAGSRTGGASDQFGDGEIDFNVSPSVPQENLEPQYSPIREYLAETFDTTAKMNVASNYSAVIQALGSGTSDIAETGPFAAALGVNADNVDIVIQRYGYGSWTYKSIIAVPNDSDIEELADLEGKTVAFSDRLSTSGALYPLYNMSQAGIEIGDLPEGNGSNAAFEAVFAGGHVSSYQQLANGQVDAAGMGGFVRDTSTGPTPDEFSQTARTLDEQTGLPRAPIVVSADMADDLKNEVQQAFLDAPEDLYYGADGEADTDDDLWFNDVRAATVDDYQSVIDVANELDVGTEIFES